MVLIEDIVIETLVLAHTEVKKNKVGRYAIKLGEGSEGPNVSVSRCIHDGRDHLADGHHRTTSRYFSRIKLVIPIAYMR